MKWKNMSSLKFSLSSLPSKMMMWCIFRRKVFNNVLLKNRKFEIDIVFELKKLKNFSPTVKKKRFYISFQKYILWAFLSIWNEDWERAQKRIYECGKRAKHYPQSKSMMFIMWENFTSNISDFLSSNLFLSAPSVFLWLYYCTFIKNHH